MRSDAGREGRSNARRYDLARAARAVAAGSGAAVSAGMLALFVVPACQRMPEEPPARPMAVESAAAAAPQAEATEAPAEEAAPAFVGSRKTKRRLGPPRDAQSRPS